MDRVIRRLSLSAAWLLLFVSLQARATLLGFDVTLSDPNVPLSYTDTITVGVGHEISPGNPTNIGQAQVFGSSLLLSNDFVDGQPDNRIVLGLEAGGADNTTGYGPGASYLFSNFKFDSPSKITDLTLTLNNIDGVSKGAQVVFGTNSVQVFIDTLTIPQFQASCISQAQCGTITMDLTVQQVPEPEVWALLSVGIVAVLAISRRNRGRHA